ncbi:MAG: type II toxin-antitoxin system HicB family antitoxin [bacterium]|nr:type II toxin-antitoxin system HicB family antitoxin [bacterium]
MKEAYKIVVYKEGKYYVAQCLNIDVSSFGTTENAAIKNLKEALELYLEDSRETSTTIEDPKVRTLHLQHV